MPWLPGSTESESKEILMSDAQIPASVIPELVEHLMSSREYAERHFSVFDAFFWANDKGDNGCVKETLTAALEAFNDRETK
jgi:hypothetical protein